MYFFHASRFLQAFFWGGALKIPGSGKSTLVGALMLSAGAISERELMKRRKDLNYRVGWKLPWIPFESRVCFVIMNK